MYAQKSSGGQGLMELYKYMYDEKNKIRNPVPLRNS